MPRDHCSIHHARSIVAASASTAGSRRTGSVVEIRRHARLAAVTLEAGRGRRRTRISSRRSFARRGAMTSWEFERSSRRPDPRRLRSASFSSPPPRLRRHSRAHRGECRDAVGACAPASRDRRLRGAREGERRTVGRTAYAREQSRPSRDRHEAGRDRRLAKHGRIVRAATRAGGAGEGGEDHDAGSLEAGALVTPGTGSDGFERYARQRGDVRADRDCVRAYIAERRWRGRTVRARPVAPSGRPCSPTSASHAATSSGPRRGWPALSPNARLFA